MNKHAKHPEILMRLKRAEGHLRRVMSMLENGSDSCVDIAQQLHAVAKALTNAKTTFIHEHLATCLDESLQNAHELDRKDLHEFKQIAKYL